TFGNYNPAAGASFGFAILNDIETYFFMSAAQGDSRSNVLQAPKVTLINGQYAMVQDTTDRPFVTGLNPVVGDFAVAMQPVVEVIPEGTMLGVDGVVSSDRRYVRMNLSPMFSTVSDTIQTFDTGTGTVTQWNTSTNTTQSNQTTQNNQTTTDGNYAPVIGGVVMQPMTTTFSVMTSVSVPDGGTILMGGVKRLKEGRKEYGIPMVNKIPYLKRLFSNTAVGRETQSMMLMVTPHIIIQEEYEESMSSATENR
ncbi:MAG: type II and III secretion system protein, partial [Planctomycetaceae bacterium]|nr:type II and III secretion system protein [Planctomycetaceae bacterium]